MGEKAFMIGHSGDWEATSRSEWPVPEDRNYQFRLVLPKVGIVR